MRNNSCCVYLEEDARRALYKYLMDLERSGEAMEHEAELCEDVETVSEFTYLSDRVSGGG